ncbi:MAG: 50S ribosomal protein L11 [Candidatus Ranarchaeia archaeon]
MGEKVTCEALIEGGKASAGPPIGPTLGGTGANLFQIVQKINDLTKDYAGLKVPVKIVVDKDTKEFDIEVGMPPTSALLLNAAKIAKGSSNTGTENVGNVTLEQVISIAKSKMASLTAASLKNAVRTVLGTARSCGLTVDERPVQEVMIDLQEGKLDSVLKE